MQESFIFKVLYIQFLCKNKRQKDFNGGFPGGAVVENPPANARDTGSIPGPGRPHMPQSN